MSQHLVAWLTQQAANTIGAAFVFVVPIGNCYRVVVIHGQRLAHSLGTLTDSARPALRVQQFRVPLVRDAVRADQPPATCTVSG